MNAPREYKNWVNFLRQKFGKKNGVVDTCLFDSPEMERKLNKDRKSTRLNSSHSAKSRMPSSA